MTKIGDIEAEYYTNEHKGERIVILRTRTVGDEDGPTFEGFIVRAEGSRLQHLGKPGFWEYSKVTRLPNDEFPERFPRYIVEIRPIRGGERFINAMGQISLVSTAISCEGTHVRTVIVGEA